MKSREEREKKIGTKLQEQKTVVVVVTSEVIF